MVPDDLVAGYLLPFRRPDVMLRVDQWVADEANVRQDADEVGCWHRVPFVPVDFGVVDLDARLLEIHGVELHGCRREVELTINVGASIAPRRIQSLQS